MRSVPSIARGAVLLFVCSRICVAAEPRQVELIIGAAVAAPGGRWRDVLRGEERSFSSAEPLERLLDDTGLAVFERLTAASG